jgi:hypothetical protein
MKKFIFLLLALIPISAFAGSAASSFSTTALDKNVYAAKNIVFQQLGPCTSGAYDTIGAGFSNYFGPFALSADFTRPHFIGFRCFSAKGALGATCTTAVDYQIIGGTSWSDTAASGWVSFDSIKAAAGNNCRYVKIDTLPGVAIVFRLHCLANSSTAVVAKNVRIVFKSMATDYIDTKK